MRRIYPPDWLVVSEELKEPRPELPDAIDDTLTAREWTEEDDGTIIEMYNEGSSYSDIADELELNDSAIVSRVNTLRRQKKIAQEKTRKSGKPHDEEIITLTLSGLLPKEVAAKLGLPHETVARRVSTLRHAKRLPPGKNTSWTPEEDEYLKTNYKHSRENVRQMAEHLGRTVYGVWNRIQVLSLARGRWRAA